MEPEVVVPAVEEASEGDPAEVVRANAEAKCRSVAASRPPGCFVVAGDTEVVVDGEVLGKPADEAQAEQYLRLLAGRPHEVFGAVSVCGPTASDREPRTEVCVTAVTFAPADEALIAACLASGEWIGRAGGYAVQGLGAGMVESVLGDLSNVIGLSLPALARMAPRLVPHARHNQG